MTVTEEFVDFLDSQLSDDLATKDRDIAVIRDAYGFGEREYVRYEDMAQAHGMVSRERIRQVIDKGFRYNIGPADLPQARAMGHFIEGCNCIPVRALQQRLIDEGFVDGRVVIRGILKLMSEFDLCRTHRLHHSGLKRLRLVDPQDGDGVVLLREVVQTRYRGLLKRARKLPGLHGLVSMDALREHLADADHDEVKDIVELVRVSPNATTIQYGEQEWFLFEDQPNTLISNTQKAFSIGGPYDRRLLSESLARSLTARSTEYEKPSPEVVDAWIGASPRFQIKKGRAILAHGKAVEITGADRVVLDSLQDGSELTFPQLMKRIGRTKYSLDRISRAAMRSPLVYVNEVEGRRGHRYQLISHAAVS